MLRRKKEITMKELKKVINCLVVEAKEKTLNVAFDVDDTLFNNDLISNYLITQGYNPYKILRSFHINKLKITKEQKKCIYNIFDTKDMGKLKPNPNAVSVVETLLQYKTNKIFVITARSENLKTITNKMISRYFPGIKKNNIYYTGGKTKSDFLKNHKIDILVEDNIEAVLELAPQFPNILFYVLSYKETPHNLNVIATMPMVDNIQVIEDLTEILL